MLVRVATPADAGAIIPLVNGAYRGHDGKHCWTSEHEFVAGPRIDATRLRPLFERPGSSILVAERDGVVVGCVHLQREDDDACALGMLSVLIDEQATGVGRLLLARAEAFAKSSWGARLMVMSVVSTRVELLDWYERRGYARTGTLERFTPSGGQSSLRGDLFFERLEKRIG